MRFDKKCIEHWITEKVSKWETSVKDVRNDYQVWGWTSNEWVYDVYVSYKGTKWVVATEDETTKVKYLMLDIFDWMSVSPEIVQAYVESFGRK